MRRQIFMWGSTLNGDTVSEVRQKFTVCVSLGLDNKYVQFRIYELLSRKIVFGFEVDPH